jgi:glycosyltransferase involved in cell wall biosynthesis
MAVKLSIIVPVYNEEKTIREVIRRVLKVPLRNIKKEIIIVDDASTDNTWQILKKIKGSNIKIFCHKKNMGKGAAIRTALRHATGAIILIQDADLEYNPKEYPNLLHPILEGKSNVVYGTRLSYIRRHTEDMYLLHYFGNWILTLMTNLLFNAKLTDMETGYKVFAKEVLNGMKLRAKRFDFEPEITAKILKRGYKIHEVPIAFKARKFAEGKKITWRDGIKAIFYLVKYRIID